MAPGAGPAALLAALERLGEHVTELRLPLPVAGVERCPPAAPRGGRPARRLRPAATAPAGCAAARRRRRARPGPASRRWSTAWSASGSAPPGVLRPTTRSAGARPPPRRRRLVRASTRVLPGLARTTGQRRPTRPPCSWCPSERIPARARPARRPRHRLGRHPQPRARHPAARRRRHVAVRHDGRPLRRRGALGVPARRRHARHRGRGGARPGPAGGDRGGRAATWRAMLTEHGLGDAPLFVVPETTAYDAMLPPERHRPDARLAPRPRRRRRRAGRRRAAHARRRRPLAGRPGVRARGGRRRAGRGHGAAASGGRRRRTTARWSGRRGQRRRLAAARRGARPLAGVRRHRRAACAPWRTGSPAARPGDRRRQGQAAPGRAELPRRSSPGWRRWCARPPTRRPSRPAAAWAGDPAGAQLLGGDDLRRSSPGLARLPTRAAPVRDWQCGVLELVRAQGQGKRATARYLAFGVNGLGPDGDDRGVRAHRRADRRRGRGRRRRGGAEPEDARGGARRPGRPRRWPRRPARTCTRGWTRCSRASGAGSPTGSRRSPSTTAPARPCGPPSQDVEDGPDDAVPSAARAAPAGRPARDAGRPGRGGRGAGDGRRRRRRCSTGPARCRPARGERLRLSGEHTVVALAGATGSGKSSLFNALSGADLSPRACGGRPPPRRTRASGARTGAAPLVEWLGVPRRQTTWRHGPACARGGRRARRAGAARPARPRLDRASTHRHEVDRLVELVDLLVWVVDPQKYADAALHERYLRRLAGHDAVTRGRAQPGRHG